MKALTLALARVLSLTLTLALGTGGPAGAGDRQGDLDELAGLMGFGETVGIMRQEGVIYGEALRAEMIPDVSDLVWRAEVARIYDADKMLAVVSTEFAQALDGADLAPMLAYFRGEEAQRIVRLELSARRALAGEGVEEAARDRVERLAGEEAPLLAQVDRLIADSDMIEFNTMGQLNAQLMFYRGLVEGGAFELSEEEMLTDIWGQEEAVRADSRDWLRLFMVMAYEPLEPAELDRYEAFYRSEAGRALNRALYAGFDRMYDELSYLLGFAVAGQMQSQPL